MIILFSYFVNKFVNIFLKWFKHPTHRRKSTIYKIKNFKKKEIPLIYKLVVFLA